MGLPDLLARVEGATVGDGVLNRDIVVALTPGSKPYRYNADLYSRRENGVWYTTHVPPVTTSIDAAVALIERVMGGRQPGWTYNCRAAYDGRGSYNWFEITWPSTECQGRGRTIALAACASLLRAVQRDPALLRAKIATGEGSSECKL